MKASFWQWTTDSGGTRTLYLDGVIAEESWFADDVTPQAFKAELNKGREDIVVWINSVGGDVWAAAQIYNMLMEYPGNVTIKVDGLAASAASVIAMAGGDVLMSPVSMMMLHNPATVAMGEAADMQRAKAMLEEVKESLINSYALKTGLPREQLAQMMDDETWLSAGKAVELGFADGMLYDQRSPQEQTTACLLYSARPASKAMLRMLAGTPEPENGTPVESLQKRLHLLSH